MKFFVAIVITLVLLVQISHTIPPTIVEKSFEPNDEVSQVNQNDSTKPEVAQLDTINLEPPKISEPPFVTDSSDNGTESSKNDELIFAQVMYRHGEIDIPNNIEITNEGKKNLYELGQYFHRRYGKLLGPGYHQDKIYILSTEHDRAIMSAQANLAGLFEPTDAEKWSKKILWSPVPVHTLPTVLDNILRPRYDGRCPKYDEMYDWYIMKSKEAKKMYKKYGKLFKEWQKKIGQKIKHIEHVFSIYKKFLGEKKQGKPIPEWAEEACRPGGPMEEIGRVVYFLRAKPRLVRIRSGFLLKEMLERFDTKEKGKLKPDRVLWMYSAHSSTITTLLNGLRFNMSIPSNGFSFQFEMYKTPKDKHYLQLFLRKLGVEKPEPVDIPGCGKKCTVKEFSKVYEELIPDTFEKECAVKKPHEPENPDKPGKPNAAAISGNGRAFSIVLGSLWFIHKVFSKFHFF